MPRLRLEDATCAICMDNLFDARDDLDEVLPIATPDCGHVFHEKCLLAWFRSQADAYIAQMTDQGVTASLADSPAECPECRTECFADPESGEPAVHRLYINFTAADGNMSFTQAPSSQHPPSSPSTARWRSADKDVMSLARRARGLANELDALSAESVEDDVRGTLRRAEGLRVDAVSAKAAEGFKKYVGGLNVALNRLNARLEEHPLISTLEGRVASLTDQLAQTQRDHAHATKELQARLTRDMRAQIQKEQTRAEKEVKRASTERDLMQREVEKQKTALQTFRRAANERVEALEAELAEVRRISVLETETRKETARDLAERTKTLKMWQAKAERRGDLKRKLEQLEAENDALRNARPSRPSRSSSPKQRKADYITDNDDNDSLEVKGYGPANDSSVQETSGFEYDDLEVEDPTLESLLAVDHHHQPPKRSTTAHIFAFGNDEFEPRRSNTARTMMMGSIPSPPKRAKSTSVKPARKESGPTMANMRPTAATLAKYGGGTSGTSRSKYFSSASTSNANASIEHHEPPPRPSQSQARILVEASSPIAPRVPPTPPHPDDVIDLAGSSPDRPVRPVLRAPKSLVHPFQGRAREKSEAKKTSSITDFLGIADGKGRLKKGVATGAKARRRA